MKKSPLKLVTWLLMGLLVYSGAVYAVDDSCWRPRYPECPGGASSEHGKQCGGPGGVMEVDPNIVIAKDNFCTSKNKNCSNNNNACNQLVEWEAAWHKVSCVMADDPDKKVFLHWCLDYVIAKRPLNLGCDGKKCKTPIGGGGIGVGLAMVLPSPALTYSEVLAVN